MTKRNFDEPLRTIQGAVTYKKDEATDENGKPIFVNKVDGKGDSIPVRLKDAIVTILTGVYDNDNASGEVKFQRHRIAEKVWNDNKLGDVDFTIDELKILKDTVGKFGSSAVVRPIFLALENDLEKKDKDEKKK